MKTKNEWIYIGACSYAGEHFSIWTKPVQKKDGTLDMKTKSKKTTLEKMNEDAKEYGSKYVFSPIV